jgi:hypothetical protein
MKQVALIRDRIIRHMHELRLQISNLPEAEPEAIAALGGVPLNDPEALAETVNVLLHRLGAEIAAPKEPRFDKTLRAVQRDTPMRGRGVLTLEDRAILNGAK